MIRCASNTTDSGTANLCPDRRGVTMLEVISAMAVLAVLFGVSAKLLALASAQRRAAVERRVAAVEAQNALERLTAGLADTYQLDARAAEIALAPHAARLLPGGQIKASAVRTDESYSSRAAEFQLTVEVTWRLLSGESAAPVRLSTWVYLPGSDAQDDDALGNTNTEVGP